MVEQVKIVFKGKEYQSIRDCYNDNKDMAVVSPETFRARVLKGVAIERALTSAKHTIPQTILGAHLVEGVEYPNLPSIARTYGIKEMTVYRRYYRGCRGDDLVPPKKRKNYVPPEPKPPVYKVVIAGKGYKNLSEAFRALGVEKHTYYNRFVRGYPLEQCFGLEPFADGRKTRARTFEYKGENLTFRDILEKYGVHQSTFLRRLEKGLSIEEALTRKSRKKKAIAEPETEK
ncbi:MAG TPA: hypothetical protein PKY59_09710 [Pyrinomonadaceae bacterium]|nr:hypothetical protein [Pyrinomonadaceae bacterium]